MRFEILRQLLFRIAIERGIAIIEGNVVEARQAREDGKLGELRDAGDVEKADLVGVVLELGVDRGQLRADLLGELHVGEGLRHRVVILVNKNHRTSAVFLVKTVDRFT